MPIFVVGLILLVSAGLIAPVVGGQTYLPRLLLLSGLLVFGWALVRSARTWWHTLLRMRETAEPGPARLWLLGGAALVILSIGIGWKELRVDTTQRGLNSLSTVSRQALSTPGRPVEMIAAYREAAPAAAQAREILRLYRAQAPGVRTRQLDPEREPAEARELGIDFTNGILVRADSVREVVQELTEEAITTAILRVRHPRRGRFYFLDGHGEVGGGRSGLTEFRRLAASAGIQIDRLDLRTVPEVPADAQAILIIGPTSPLLPGEIGVLRDYLDRGGRLGVFVDPDSKLGIEPLLVGHDVLVDGRRLRDDGPLTGSVGLGPETIAVQSLGEHEITRGLTAAVVLRGATRVAPPPVLISGHQAVAFLMSAPSARILDGPRPTWLPSDTPAPASGSQPLAVAVEWPVRADSTRRSDSLRERAAARVVTVGDSDFLRDDTIGLYGNRALAGRLVSWLSTREFSLIFPALERGGTPLRGGLAQFRIIFTLVEVILPLALVGLGLFVWWRRR